MSSTILLDTGPMVALFDFSDQYHQRAIDFLSKTQTSFITSEACITEVMYLLSFSQEAQGDFLRWIMAGAVKVPELSLQSRILIVDRFEKYKDLPMDYADGTLISLAKTLGIKDVFTFDSDFEVYRIDGRKKFKILG